MIEWKKFVGLGPRHKENTMKIYGYIPLAEEGYRDPVIALVKPDEGYLLVESKDLSPKQEAYVNEFMGEEQMWADLSHDAAVKFRQKRGIPRGNIPSTVHSSESVKEGYRNSEAYLVLLFLSGIAGETLAGMVEKNLGHRYDGALRKVFT